MGFNRINIDKTRLIFLNSKQILNLYKKSDSISARDNFSVELFKLIDSVIKMSEEDILLSIDNYMKNM